MAREPFERRVELQVGPELAWRAMTDVPTLVGWMSLLRDVETIALLERYAAQLEDRLGMFSLKADLDITVSAYLEPEWIVVHAEGEDRQVGSRIVVDARVELEPSSATTGPSTAVIVTGAYEVSGRVATLGAGMIRKKAQKILDEFFGNLERAF